MAHESEKAAEILRVLRAPETDALQGFCMDLPIADSHLETYTCRMAGWIIGRRSRVVDVAVCLNGETLRRAPVTLERPDVAAIHGQAGAMSGFDVAVGLASLPREGRLRVEARFDDGSHAPLADIDYRRAGLDNDFSPTIQPLMVTSLFRMGTTRMMRLLSEHPDVLVERSYPHETCVASYWLHAFKILTEPANLHESSRPNDFVEERGWIGHNPYHREPVTSHPLVATWMGRGMIREVVNFCQRSVDGFYRSVALAQHEGSPRYFAEKHLPDSHVPDTLHECYSKAREVFLVRDFRDVVCSMIAFNNKRGFPSFGRQKVDSDEEMIELFAKRCRRLTDAWQRRRTTALLVHYEDLVRDPSSVLTATLRHAGIDHSEGTVTSLIDRADRDTPELSFHRTSRDPARSIGRWREDLPARTARLTGELLAEPLAAFGYTATG